jgi:hypothetical protein
VQVRGTGPGLSVPPPVARNPEPSRSEQVHERLRAALRATVHGTLSCGSFWVISGVRKTDGWLAVARAKDGLLIGSTILLRVYRDFRTFLSGLQYEGFAALIGRRSIL